VAEQVKKSVEEETNILLKGINVVGSQISDLTELIFLKENVKVENKITPLRLAMSNGRSRNIILTFMSKVGTDASSSYCHLYSQLIDDMSFKPYLDSLLNQTMEMELKNIVAV
jgi:hypothetical protein